MADDALEGVRAGDPAAWRAFVQQHEGVVAATVIGMVGHGPDAEDIGQEVFVRFLNQARNFRGDSSVTTYLTKSAINLSLNAIRRRGRMRRWFSGPADDVYAVAGPSPADEVEALDLGARVSKAIRQLRPEYRAVVVLRLVREFSTKEAADVLGIPPGTVMSRLARGQKALREMLKGEVGHE
jgi:RNA polymerase sigma-70 factor, ECF subfamily